MTSAQLHPILQQGEGVTIEFKTARHELGHNVFETICAFLNRLGGSLILGADDDGSPLGVDASQVNKLKAELVTLSANPQKLNPPFTIEAERVWIKNANRAVGHGLIDPRHFSPYPKNPIILNFFKQLGWADELGSGIRNVTKYLPQYAPGKEAQFVEGDRFETMVPYPYSAINDYPDGGINDRQIRIIQLIQQNQGAKLKDLQEVLAVSERTLERDIQELRKNRLIVLQGSKKAGKYQLTEQGKRLLL